MTRSCSGFVALNLMALSFVACGSSSKASGKKDAMAGASEAGATSDAISLPAPEFQSSSVCAGGPMADLLWQSSTQGIGSGTGGRVLFHDVPTAGWLVVFEANGLMRAWQSDNSRGPGPTAWPLLLWVDDSTAVSLGQADDATFSVNGQRIHVVENSSKQLNCGTPSIIKNYVSLTLTWDVFGDSDVLVARLKRDLIRGADGASLPAAISGHDEERTKSEFSTSVVDTVLAQLLGDADAAAPTQYTLQNTRPDAGADAANCEAFDGRLFWDKSRTGQAISLTGRTKGECIGVGANPQQDAEVTPNAAVFSDDSGLLANGFEDKTCAPCTDDHASAWLAHGGDVPPTSTTYFLYSYTKTFDGSVDLGQLVHALAMQAGLQ
jgi:hypothetical protein